VPETRAIHAVVHGRVQGVGFRWSAVMEARRLRLTGSVANLPDGSVEVVAEGAADALEAFRAWLERGPPGARVTSVDVDHPPVVGYDVFDVAF
jgi:acylphosphatase